MNERSNWYLEDKPKNFKFQKDFQCGVEFEFEYHEEDDYKKKKTFKLISKIDDSKPRLARLKLSSWVGISWGAAHTYAHLRLDDPDIFDIETGKPFGVRSNTFPKELDTLELEMYRPVTKKDIKYDKEQSEERGGRNPCYGNMRMGDYTGGFWTKEEAIDFSIRFFKKYFGEGWKLVSENWYDETDEQYGQKVYVETL